MLISFVVFLSVFAAIGLSSFFKSTHQADDYYLASRSVNPMLVGLSAVATNNSGYMFIGVIGYTYATGFSAVWLMLGWILGDYLASTFVHHRLRKQTASLDQVSFIGVISGWQGDSGVDNDGAAGSGRSSKTQSLMGLISLVFLLAYASAQLVAGSKALQVLFDWPAYAGVLIGTVLVISYCLAGGIRASIWTDAAQSCVMIVAMALLLVTAVVELGGIESTLAAMSEVDGYLDVFPSDLVLPGIAGGLLFILGWACAGFSVIGQPHIMVRFMTLRNLGDMRRARLWYYLWFTGFYALATAVGMLSRVYLPDVAGFDAELALPTMALQLLPPVLVGLVLAGIFAATLSTADSLVLSCSSALTHDIFPESVTSPAKIKFATFLIAILAATWALLNQQSVFSLVLMAWSGLASAFAPLLLSRCFGWRQSNAVALAAILAGLSVAIGWRLLGLQSALYEGAPGMVAGLVILFVGHRRSGNWLDVKPALVEP